MQFNLYFWTLDPFRNKISAVVFCTQTIHLGPVLYITVVLYLSWPFLRVAIKRGSTVTVTQHSMYQSCYEVFLAYTVLVMHGVW